MNDLLDKGPNKRNRETKPEVSPNNNMRGKQEVLFSTYRCYINPVSVKSKSYCKVKSLRVCSVNKVNPISINNVLILFHQSTWMSSKVVHKYIYIKMSKLNR